MSLAKLHLKKGAKTVKTRRGRGPGSGLGKTGGRGQKGQTSRTGSGKRPGFEGGQTPLLRRIPKSGFVSAGRERITTAIVNVSDLARFGAGAAVTPASLRASGLVSGNYDRIKILGEGDLKLSLTVSAHAFSKSAMEKIAAAGGKAEVVA